MYQKVIIMSRKCAYISAFLWVEKMNDRVEKRIGENIRKLRERAGYTQEYVATKLQLSGCDITRSAVAKIEVGQRHLYPDEIILLKQILKADYSEIFEM